VNSLTPSPPLSRVDLYVYFGLGYPFSVGTRAIGTGGTNELWHGTGDEYTGACFRLGLEERLGDDFPHLDFAPLALGVTQTKAIISWKFVSSVTLRLGRYYAEHCVCVEAVAGLSLRRAAVGLHGNPLAGLGEFGWGSWGR
jgi:hypothetical protein